MDKLPFVLIQEWIKPLKAEELMYQLINNLKWNQPQINVYGKKYLVPRLTTFLADRKIIYTYSGVVNVGKGCPSWFIPLLIRVQKYCKTEFNGCLLNLYRNGDDCMGWHSDNEKELDALKSIASLSLGSSRDFFLRNNLSSEKKSISLQNGDLLIMKPDCQKYWSHSIPRRRRVKDIRINLTFRRYK